MSSSSNPLVSSVETLAASHDLFQHLESSSESQNSTSPSRLPTAGTAAATAVSGNTVPMERQPTEENISKYGSLLPFVLDDVQLSNTEDQPSMKGKRNVNTCLVGIGTIKAIEISSKQLRNWALREKIGVRQGQKSDICNAIVAFVKEYRRKKARGLDYQEPETIFARSKINYVRAINVLTIESIKAKLVHRGAQIGRVELEEGLRADEDLWKSFAGIYNDGNIATLGSLLYEVDWKGAIPDPSSFSAITWKKAERVFKDIGSKYDTGHKKWKQSGFHGDFEDIPFDNFVTQPWLVYLHLFLQENPGLLQVVTSDLQEESFFESSTGVSDIEDNNTTAASSSTAATGRKRKASSSSGKKKQKDNRDDIFRTIANATVKNSEAAESKNAAISYSALSISRTNAQQSLDAAKATKRGAMRYLKQHPFTRGSPSRARKITKTVKKKVDPSPAKSDTSDQFIYSQSTTASIRNVGSYDTVHQHAADIIDADKEIKNRTQEINHLEKKMGAFHGKEEEQKQMG